MTCDTRPLSIRLKTANIDQLTERAKRMSGTPTGVARELILSGLTDGDPYAQAQRLLAIERKLASISQDVIATTQSSTRNADTLIRLERMFDQLLQALSGHIIEESQSHV